MVVDIVGFPELHAKPISRSKYSKIYNAIDILRIGERIRVSDLSPYEVYHTTEAIKNHLKRRHLFDKYKITVERPLIYIDRI